MRVLVVEDDDAMAEALTTALRDYGHSSVRCATGAQALDAHQAADVVLLDLILPDSRNLEALCRLRRVSSVPVIVLTALRNEQLVVRGLRSGADDYLFKPVRKQELLARIEAVTRRAGRGGSDRPVTLGDVVIDLDAHAVRVGGEPVGLTATEFEILALLARHAGSAVSRRQVMDEVWGGADPGRSLTLNVHLSGLRAKLGRPELLTTIRGFGYRLG